MDSLFSNFDDISRMSREKASKNLQETENSIKADFAQIAKVIQLYNPLQVMKMAADHSYQTLSRVTGSMQIATASLLPLLMQSIVTSTLYDASRLSQNRNVSQKDWKRLLSLNDSVTARFLRYIDFLTLVRVNEGLISRDNVDIYRTALYKLIFPPLENVVSIEESKTTLLAMIENSEEKLENIFNISAKDFTDSLAKLSEESLLGLGEVKIQEELLKSEIALAVENRRLRGDKSYLNDEDLRRLVIKEGGYQYKIDKINGKKYDFDLYRPDFYIDIPKESYIASSIEMGSQDITEVFRTGFWPVSLHPVIRCGDFFLSFITSHALTYGNRLLYATLNGSYRSRYSVAEQACSSLFNGTDSVDIYSFDGNRIRIIVLPSLMEINPFAYPKAFDNRLELRNQELIGQDKASIYATLIIDSDGVEALVKEKDGYFRVSAAYLLKSSRTKEGRMGIYSTIFGILELPEGEKVYEEAVDKFEFAHPSDENNEELLADDEDSSFTDYAEEDEFLSEAEEQEQKDSSEEESPSEISVDRAKEAERLSRLREKYALPDELKEKYDSINPTMDNSFDDDEYDSEDTEEAEEYVEDSETAETALLDEVDDEDSYSEDEEESSSEEQYQYDDHQLDFFAVLDDEESEDKEEVEEAETNEDDDYFEEYVDHAYDEERENPSLERAEGTEIQREVDELSLSLDAAANSEDTSTKGEEEVPAQEAQEIKEDNTQPESSKPIEERSESSGIVYNLKDMTDSDDNEELFIGEEEEISLDDEDFRSTAPIIGKSRADSEEEAKKEVEKLKEELRDDPYFTALDLDKFDESSKEEKSEVAEEITEAAPQAEELPKTEEEAPAEPPKRKLTWAEEFLRAALDLDDAPLPQREEENELAKGETDDEAKAPIDLNTILKDEAAVAKPIDLNTLIQEETQGEELPSLAEESVTVEDNNLIDLNSPTKIEEAPSIEEEAKATEEEESNSALADLNSSIEEEKSEASVEEMATNEDQVANQEELKNDNEDPQSIDLNSLEEDQSTSSALSTSNEEANIATSADEEKAEEEAPLKEEEVKGAETSATDELSPKAVEIKSEEVKKEAEAAPIPQEEKAKSVKDDRASGPDNRRKNWQKRYSEVTPTLVKTADGTFILRAPVSSDDLNLNVGGLSDKREEKSEEELLDSKLDGILLEVRRSIGTTTGAFADFVRDSDQELLNYTADVIRNSWVRQQGDHKDKFFTIFDYKMTVLLAKDPVRDELRRSELLNNAGAVMYSKSQDKWNVLMVYINNDYHVEMAEDIAISKSTFSAFDWKRVTNIGELLKQRGR